MHVLGNMYTQVFVVATAKVTKTNKPPENSNTNFSISAAHIVTLMETVGQ